MKELNLNATCTMKDLIDAEVGYMLDADRCHAAKDYKAEDADDLKAAAIERTIVKVFGVSANDVTMAVCETFDDRMKEQIQESLQDDSFYFG